MSSCGLGGVFSIRRTVALKRACAPSDSPDSTAGSSFMAAPIGSEPHFTTDHFVGFGMIVQQFAQIDALLEEAIRDMLNLQIEQSGFLMPELRHEQKRNIFLAVLDSVNVNPERKAAVQKLIEEIVTKSRLRNHVAHSIWMRGRKPGNIKPISLTVKAKIKALGVHHNEKEYSAQDLMNEAYDISRIYQELHAFLAQGGDHLKDSEQKL